MSILFFSCTFRKKEKGTRKGDFLGDFISLEEVTIKVSYPLISRFTQQMRAHFNLLKKLAMQIMKSCFFLVIPLNATFHDLTGEGLESSMQTMRAYQSVCLM